MLPAVPIYFIHLGGETMWSKVSCLRKQHNNKETNLAFNQQPAVCWSKVRWKVWHASHYSPPCLIFTLCVMLAPTKAIFFTCRLMRQLWRKDTSKGQWLKLTGLFALIYSGALRAPKARARGAPLIRDFGKPISARKFGLVMTSLRPTDRPPVRTYAPPCKPMWNETLKPCAATRVNFSAGNCVANCAAARVCLAGSCIANCVWEKNKK